MFYVYILKNPITGLPFYVGVGKQNRRSGTTREKSHIVEALKFKSGKMLKSANRHKLNTILQILDQGMSVDIEIINDPSFSSESNAFNEEIRLIALYGRRDLATGILTNMTDGGEGRVNPSADERKRASEIRKGKPSPLKGEILGPYSEERKASQKEKMRATREKLSLEECDIQHENRSKAQLGKIPWNKGKTKNSDPRVANYANSKVGKSRPDMIGKEPWNKGKKCPELGIFNIGKPAYNKGIPSNKKGMTYEQIHGPIKAAELKEKRREDKVNYWKNKTKNDDK